MQFLDVPAIEWSNLLELLSMCNLYEHISRNKLFHVKFFLFFFVFMWEVDECFWSCILWNNGEDAHAHRRIYLKHECQNWVNILLRSKVI